MKFLSIFLLLCSFSCQQKSPNSEKKIVISKKDTSIVQKDTKPLNDNLQDSESNLSDTIPTNNKKQTDNQEADSSFQEEANIKLRKLLEYFGKKTPDYYGGAFIDEKGSLVVNIKGDFENGKTKIKKIIGPDKILFQNKKFSHAELTAIMDYLNSFASKSENRKYMENLSGWSLMEIENYVEVCFVEMKKNSEIEFRKNILNSDAIKFKQCGKFVLQ